MRPFWKTAKKRLQMGQYLVHIADNEGVIVCPITMAEYAASSRIIGASNGLQRPNFKLKSPGMYLLKVDQYGRISNASGMTVEESRKFILNMGARA